MRFHVPDPRPTQRLLTPEFWLLVPLLELLVLLVLLVLLNSFYRTHRMELPIRCALDFLVLIECGTSTALTEPSLDGA
jgi:hypothetical protein